MRTYLRGKITLLFMTLGLLLAVPTVAFADDVYNNLDNTIDATAESITLTAGGTHDTASLLISPTDGDGKSGCNLTGSTTLQVAADTANNTDPAKVAVSLLDPTTGAAKDTFTSCGDSIKVKVEALAATGQTPVTVSIREVSNTTGRTFTLAPATFTVTVNAAAPSCTNPADPTFSGTPDGSNGWYKTIPTVSASSTTSGAVVKYSDAADGTYSTTAPTLGQGTTTVYAKAFDSTGNCSSAAVSNTYKVDTIAPSINDDGPTTNPNGAGWYNTPVVNKFSASDATSGLASAASFTKSSGTAEEGSEVKINSGPVSDNAGNTNPGIDSATFKIDLTKPVVSVTGVSNGATYTLGSVPTAGCNTTDALSGVKTEASLSVTGGPVGSVTAKCDGASDNADNTNSASVTYNVEYAWNSFRQPVDNGGVFNAVKAGQSIPMKFSLSGNQGLGVIAAGFPKVTAVTCPSATTIVDQIEETTTANQGLVYDSSIDQYNYVWKTQSTYAGKCYRFDMKLIDNTTHSALFKFTK